MIKKQITLVLGAGASAPYGFPLGGDLKMQAIRQLRGPNEPLKELFSQMGFRRALQAEFAEALAVSHQPSIDAFLQERGEEFLDLGKAVIAALLIPYEIYNNLLYDEVPSSNQLDGRWYAYLLDMMGTSKEFCDNQLSVITFNYDRSLEYFFFNALRARFNLKEQQAIEYMKSMPIVHVYGKLGEPDFMDSEDGRPYDGLVSSSAIFQCVQEMHLMHENRDETEFMNRNEPVYEILKRTYRLIFLGFGFHEKNLQRLMLREYLNASIIVTLFNRAPGERERDLNRLVQYSPPGLQILDYASTVRDFLGNTNFIT